MKLKIYLITVALFVVSFGMYGQTIVTVGGGATITCPATPTATWTTPPTGVTFSNWSRGSGVTCGSAGNGLSGAAFNTADAATSFAANKFYSVTLTAAATHNFTLNGVVWNTAVNNGPANFTVQYVNNGGTRTTLGTAAQTSTSTNTFTATSTITVAAGTSIVIYLIPAGTNAESRTVRWLNGSTISVTATPISDITAPLLSTLSPLDNATSVSTTSNLALTFNENIVKGTGNILIKRSSDSTTFETIDVMGSLVTISGATATINPSGTLANSTGYYVEIPSTAFKDAANNFYLGISGATAWNFTTVSAATPVIAIADNGTAVAAANVNQGASNHILATFKADVTTANATITDANIYFDGTYTAADIVASGMKLWYNSTNNFSTATTLQSKTATAAGAGEIISFTGLSQSVAIGTGYFWVTASLSATATVGRTIRALSVANTDLLFSSGTKSGSATISGAQTVVAFASGCNELFISEYGEGTSNNKYIEIYNPTASTINLGTGSYDIAVYANGSATPTSTIALTGTVAANSTFLLQHNSATTGITANQVSGSLTFNGNDAVALRKAMVLIDVIGQIGNDPGTQWGTTPTTADNTLVRKSTIRTGDNNGSNAFDPATEWDGFAGDTWTNIGTHESDCDTTPKITLSTTTLTGFGYASGSGPSAEQSFTVSGKNLLANLIVTPPTNYEISSTSGTGFVSSPSTLSFAPTSGIVTDKTIYVRLKSGLGVGTYSQDVSATSTSAATKNVTCGGSVIPPFYRSKQSGAWETAGNWESSANNSTWATATVAPANTTTAITILNTHNISISSGSVSADDITVATGGTLTISGGTLILNNGAATTDLQVNGTLTYSSGTFTQGTSGIAFGANSTYNHALASSAIPTATWDAASTCVVTGMAGTGTGPTNVGQNYGNFTWNCTGQTAFFNINSNAFQVRGLFRVLSTGTQNLSMAGTTAGTYTNTINAASIEGGIFAIAFSTGVTSTTTITNDFSISGGEVRINGANGTGTLNIGRDLLMSGTGYLNPLFLSTSLSTTITIARDLTMSGNSIIDFESVDIPAASTIINVGRNFTSTSSGDTTNFVVIDFGGSTISGAVAGNALNIAGNFSYTGTGQIQTFSNNAPTGIVFNGSGTKTFAYTTAGSLNWVPITINTGTTLQLQNSFSIGQSATTPVTTITVNGSLDFQTFSITATTNTVPRFNTSAGATIITSNTAGLGGTGTTGSLRGFGSIAATTPANGKIVFLAGTNYTFNGATTTPFPNGTIGNPSNIVVNGIVTTNLTSNLTTTGTTTINTAGSLTLNGNYSLSISNPLFIAEGAVFDNGGESQITGSGAITINGKFITRDVQGFVDTNTAITLTSRSLPTLGTNSTIEYGLVGDQAVQGLQAPTYQNITFSGGGTKTLVSANSVVGIISVLGGTTFDAGNSGFGSGTSSITMTGASVYKLGGSGIKPDSGISYTLGTDSTFEFTGSSATQIRLAPSYAKVIVSGTNVKAGSTDEGGLTFQNPGSFTVKNNGVFKVTNTTGFTGSATAAIKNTTSPTITLESGSTIEYSGANQTITALPFALNSLTSTTTYSNLKISGTMTKLLPATEVLVNNNLDITSSKIQIDAQKLLTVVNTINTIDEGIDIKNSGNLVQLANVLNTATTNIGKIKMTRTSRLMFDNDYIYWGSPVKENVIAQIPSNFDSTYQWDLTGAIDGAWNALSAVVPGRGFITKVASGVTTVTNFDFIGTPNHGTVNVVANGYDTDFNLDATGNTILLSNPYPSAIDANTFINANPLLDGNLYFWTSATANTGSAYSAGDYATWNRTGSVGTKATNDMSGNDNLKPSGKIAAGQGFFADIHADGIVSFTNAMRERTTSGNAQFFKTTKPNRVNEQKSRVWLNLSNTKKAFRQMLVAYISNATNSFDRDYDAESFTGNEIDIYSILENKNLVIQGRALPLDDADLVPLGISITNAGAYTIDLDEVDGLMTNKAIYLEDKLLNKTHNLSEGAYTFNTASGIFNNRFVLRYTDTTLGTKEPIFAENQVLVFAKSKQLTVHSSIENIDAITVYDLVGRQLFEKENISTKEFIVTNMAAKQQLLLVKVLLENGKVLTQKVVF